jgi:hypothetical protein
MMVFISAFLFFISLCSGKKTLTLQGAINLRLTNSKELKNNQAYIAETTAVVREACEHQ